MPIVTDVLSAGFADERLQCGQSRNPSFFRYHVTTGHAPALHVSRILSQALTCCGILPFLSCWEKKGLGADEGVNIQL